MHHKYIIEKLATARETLKPLQVVMDVKVWDSAL
jgi:hypothetical protein